MKPLKIIELLAKLNQLLLRFGASIPWAYRHTIDKIAFVGFLNTKEIIAEESLIIYLGEAYY